MASWLESQGQYRFSLWQANSFIPPLVVHCSLKVKVEWQLTSPFDPTADVEGEEGGQEYARDRELQ